MSAPVGMSRLAPEYAPTDSRPAQCGHPEARVISNESLDGQVTFHKCTTCGAFWQSPAEFRRRLA